MMKLHGGLEEYEYHIKIEQNKDIKYVGEVEVQELPFHQHLSKTEKYTVTFHPVDILIYISRPEYKIAKLGDSGGMKSSCSDECADGVDVVVVEHDIVEAVSVAYRLSDNGKYSIVKKFQETIGFTKKNVHRMDKRKIVEKLMPIMEKYKLNEKEFIGDIEFGMNLKQYLL